jgi:hypothetical protein
MPSKSKAQAKTMKAAAHNPQFAKKVGIPQPVAKDFAKADAKAGGPPKGKSPPPSKAKSSPPAPSPMPSVTAGPQAGNVDPGSLASVFVKKVGFPTG